jgi:predicted ribosomally synthesized peptide with SipW-like signal peptide
MKNTRKLLVSSMIMILSCCLLFAGTTFAWFSDSVTSENNIITAGNLDVKLEYSFTAEKEEDWKVVEEDTSILTEGDKWEPGFTKVVYFRISNIGSLDFKYSFNMKINETPATNVAGNQFNLSDYLKFGSYFKEAEKLEKLENRNAYVDEATGKLNKNNVLVGNPAVQLDAGDKVFGWLVITMPTTVGNEANAKPGTKAPSIKVSFDLFATQVNREEDSYVTPWTIDAALANAKENSEIKLVAGFYEQIVIPQNGMKIYSEEGAVVGFLNVNGKENVTIQGLTFDAASALTAYDGRGKAKVVTNLVGANGSSNKLGARNLVIDECTFIGNFANGGASIAFVDQNRTTGQSGNITINNCKFEQTGAYYNVYTHYSGYEKFEILNNVFASKCVGNPIYLGRYQSGEPVVVKGNTFKYTDNLDNSVYLQDHSNYGVSVADENNTFGELINYATPSTIATVLANAQEGYVVELGAGTYNEIVVPQNGMKIYSLEGAVVGFLNVNGKADVTIQGLTFDAALAKAPYNFKDKAMTPANIVGASGSSNKIGARNLVIDGCTFTGEFANGGVSIAFVDQNRTTGQSGNITIKNCEFDQQNAYTNIYTYYSGYGQFVIEGNDFVGSTIDYPMYLGRYQSNEAVSVKGNTFSHAASIEKALSLQAHSSAYNPSYVSEGNVFAE